jgi:hypothetical protein
MAQGMARQFYDREVGYFTFAAQPQSARLEGLREGVILRGHVMLPALLTRAAEVIE